MDSDERKPLLLRSPTSTSPSRDGASVSDDLPGDRARHYSPPRSPSPATPSPLAVGVAKGQPTSASSTSPPAEVFPKNPTASDADVPSNGSGTRGAVSPRPSQTPSSPADIGKQADGPQPRTSPKDQEAQATVNSKNHQEVPETASTGEENEKAAASAGETPRRTPRKEEDEEVVASTRKKKAEESFDCFPSPFPGVSTSWEKGDCSNGRSVSDGVNHVVDVDGLSPATVLTSVDNSEAEGRDLAALIRRAEELFHYFIGHHILADPSAQVTVALRTFAVAADATTSAALWLEEAAAALDKVCRNPELDVVLASAAKLLALEAAAALAAHRREQEPNVSVSAAPAAGQVSGTSNELYWVAITGSLALLPSLPEKFPEGLHFVLALVFAAVFSVASIGAVMSVRAIYKGCARALGVFSFTAFSVLVLAFVSFVLAQGNIHLIWVGAVILVVAHLMIFWMSRK